MDPIVTLGACNLLSTDTVADFGAGSGFVARAAAALVPQGQVFAIEINRDIVARLNRDVESFNIKNMHPIWGDIEVRGGSSLKDESVQFVIFSNLLFQLDDKVGALREAYRVLVPGGRMLIVDWSESYGGMGPAPHHVFNKDRALESLTKAGFTLLPAAIPAGEHHYAMLCNK